MIRTKMYCSCKATEVYRSISWAHAFPSMIVELLATIIHKSLNWSHQLLCHNLEGSNNHKVSDSMIATCGSIMPIHYTIYERDFLLVHFSPCSFLQSLLETSFALRRRINLSVFILGSNLCGGSNYKGV